MVYEMEHASPADEGGEARWMARADVDEQGHLRGWQARYMDMVARLQFDEMGRPMGAGGVVMEGAEVDALPPALQLEARAAMRAQPQPDEEITVTDDATWPAPKVKGKGRHINLAVQRRNRDRAALAQARYDITVAYTLDGSWADVPKGEGVERATACA